MYSMTGYGKAEFKNDRFNILVEAKTVNNRNLDLSVKCPRSFIPFEDSIRKIVQKNVKRGRIDVFVTVIDYREKEVQLELNQEIAKSYISIAKTLSENLTLTNDLTVSKLMKVPDVISVNPKLENVEEMQEVVLSLTDECMQNLNQMRKVEGAKLIIDMKERVLTIKSIVEKIAQRSPFVVLEHRKKLQDRMQLALQDVNIDEAKLLNEVAFFTDKCNIDEEITRLNSHIEQFNEIVKGETIGKKLDFLIQEFNRESNTICSKANDLQVTNFGLDLKSEIEKIREQVQNIE